MRDVDDVQLGTISTVGFEFAAHSEIELSGSGFQKEFTARSADEGEEFADAIRGQLTA